MWRLPWPRKARTASPVAGGAADAKAAVTGRRWRAPQVRAMRATAWLASGSDEQVDAYIADNGVLVNPLVHDGYPSIGCWPCTRRVAPGDDPRSGRWAGTSKTECGIHA